MKTLKIILSAIVLLLIGIWLIYKYSTENFIDLSAYDYLYVEPSENINPTSVTVQFVGVSTMLISDGTTSIMTDGYFTRPSVLNLYQSQKNPKLEPNIEDIDYGLKRLGVTTLDVVITVHSHFDHAMDAPEVAKRTGATLYGSLSTANIARGWDLAEEQISIYQNQVPIYIGDFRITPILTNHYEFPDPVLREQALGGNQTITAPLVPPVKLLDYKMGGHYTLYVEHPKGNFILQGSAGWKEGTLDSLQSDILFMGIAGLGVQSDKYRERYFEEMLDVTKAKDVYLIHWDGFTAPIDGPLNTECLLLETYMPSQSEKTFDYVLEAVKSRSGTQAHLLPRWDKVVLFE